MSFLDTLTKKLGFNQQDKAFYPTPTGAPIPQQSSFINTLASKLPVKTEIKKPLPVQTPQSRYQQYKEEADIAKQESDRLNSPAGKTLSFIGDVVPRTMKTLANLPKDIVVGAERFGARSAKSLGMTGANIISPGGESSFTPTTSLEKIVYGAKPIKTVGGTGENDISGINKATDYFNEKTGLHIPNVPEKNKILAGTVGIAGMVGEGFLNFFGGGEKVAVKTALENLVKTDAPEAATQIFKDVFHFSDETAAKFAPLVKDANTKEAVETLIKDAGAHEAFVLKNKAKSELQTLIEKEDGVDVSHPTTGEKMHTDGTPLTAQETQLKNFLTEHQDDPEVLASMFNRKIMKDAKPPAELPPEGGIGDLAYHGSPEGKNFNKVEPNKLTNGELGEGFYYTRNKGKAGGFAEPREGGNPDLSEVKPFSTSDGFNIKKITRGEYIKDIRKMDGSEAPRDALLKQYKKEGYDGLELTDEDQGVIFPHATDRVEFTSSSVPKESIQPPLETQSNISPEQDSIKSYNGTIPANEKERKLLTSLKDNPKYADIFKDTIDNYDQITNKESLSKAEDLLQNKPDEAKALAYSNSISLEAQAVRISLMEQAVAKGDFEEVARIANASNIAQRATEAGQAVQINRILGGHIDTPTKAIVTAEKNFNDFIDKAEPEFNSSIEDISKKVNEVNEEAVDTIIKETPEIKNKAKKELSLKEQIEKSNRALTPEEELAQRITPFYTAQKPNAIKDMINTLFKVAEEMLPKKGKAVPRDAIDLIGKALRDKETYKDIWIKAQDIVKEKYKSDPKAVELLDSYFSKALEGENLPVAQKQINQAVKQEIKKSEIDLSQIVKEHFTVADQIGKDLAKKLIEKGDIPKADAEILAKKIEDRFKELVIQKKEGILNKMFADRKIPEDKSFVDRMIEMSNLGAFNKAEFRSGMAKKLGLPVIDEALAKQLSEQATKIGNLPKGYEKYKATEELLKTISDQIPTTKAEIIGNLLNIPRTLMSSFDLSFPFRQGIFTAPSFPKEFGGAFKKQFGMFANQKSYEEIMDSVIKDPHFDLAEKSGLSFTDISKNMNTREEAFMSSYAERLPLVGTMIKKSSRAYTGTANKLRMDVFSNMINHAEELGINNPKTAKEIANFVNIATGRGPLGAKIEGAAQALNAIFFSPRLMSSRLSLLNPLYYVKATPEVRKQALKSLTLFAGAATTVLGLSKLAGADVGTDPRSADFGKMKFGNTRIDVLGGFQQYIRIAAQLITGKYISTTTGKVTTLGEGYKPMTRGDILLRGLESKESPIASFVADMISGTNFKGEDTHTLKGLGNSIKDRITPMLASTFIDLYKDDPKSLPLGLPSIFGFGVQTYPMAPQIIEMNRIEHSSDPAAEFDALKAKDPGMADKVAQAKIQADYTERDWELSTKGVQNGERAKEIFNDLNKLKTDEEKSNMWDDLESKKLISDIVGEQLKILIAK